MAKDFRLDLDGALGVANEIKAAAEELDAAFGKLKSVVDDHYGCWGTDEVGKAFAKNFETPERQLRQSSGQCIENCHQMADQFSGAADGFEAADEENAKALRQS